MPERSGPQRQVWSYRLCPSQPEDELERLESLLLEREADIWEDAEALRRYLALTRLSQAECARRLGRSQAAIANRLRILKLPEEVRAALRQAGLSERHARALLRLPDDDSRRSAAAVMIRRSFTVAQSEDFVEALLSPQGTAACLHAERREAVGELWSQLSRLQSRCPGLSMELREEKKSVLILLRLPKE